MWKSLGFVAIGVLLGATVAIVVRGIPAETKAPDSRPAAIHSLPTLSVADTERARESNFAGLDSIEEILALPTEFSRREALHVMAGRANAEKLQKLIFDSDRIADRTVRDTVLTILFRRLAEVDPQTALALSRIDPFGKDDGLESAIWRTWARNDLDEAIFSVNAQTRRSDQEDAAQSLYAAYGYMGNETTDRIARELGIEPSRQTRLRFLRTLLQQSPEQAIEYISAEPSALRRREYINWLAYALDADDQDAALSFAPSFAAASDRDLFKDLVEDRFARLNPIATLQQALASNSVGSDSDFQSAFQELASTDIDSALNFFGQIDAPQAKTIAAFVIANELARSDPVAALDWARSLDSSRKQQIEGILLARIAESDPEFALEAAVQLPITRRTSSIANILRTVAQSDPSKALALLATLPAETDKSRIQRQVAQTWLMQDPTAAMAWLKTLESGEASAIATRMARMMAVARPETSYQLLALLEQPQRVRSARDLVAHFASVGDVVRARALLEEYKGQEGFEYAEANLIAGLARHDSAAATQLALQLQDDESRNRALSSVTASIAEHDPARAVSLLPNITDADSRRQATQTIAARWYQSNPDAALQWLSSLSTSEGRDSAIMGMMSAGGGDVSQRELSLVETISEPQLRLQAKQIAIARLARTDQEAALRMLEGLDIPAEEKAKYRESIRKAGASR